MPLNHNTDNDWERLGASDPYYAVLSESSFRRANLVDESMAAFFSSGEKHVQEVMENIRKHIDSNFTPANVLDFGCGVGRLVIPFAKIAKHVVGADVSTAMLDEARANCAKRNVANVSIIKSDDQLTLLTDQYDLIHSYIVFQHISMKRGERIFSELLTHLKVGGVGAFHFTFGRSDRSQARQRFIQGAKHYLPFSAIIANLLRGRNLFRPRMEMSAYDLNSIFALIEKHAANIYVTYANQGEYLGVQIYFKKML
ncbi:MAG: class I SAM-dependent methyltransferase [Terracidiphilus sp.]